MVNGLMDAVNFNWFFNGLTGPLIGGLSIYVTFFDTATKHEHGTTIGKMPVHAIMPELVNNIRLVHLLFYRSVRPALYHHIPTEFTGQDHQSPVQSTALIQVLDQLSNGAINLFFHIL